MSSPEYTRRELLPLLGGTALALAIGAPLFAKFVKETSVKGENNPREIPLPSGSERPYHQAETLSSVWLPETVRRWEPLINEVSQKYKINPDFLAIIILCESGGNFCAVSREGGFGLGRIKEFNAQEKNLFDPKDNLEIAAGYLVEQQQKFSSGREKAFLAYHCGPGNVEKGIISDEGKNLLDFVTGMYQQREEQKSSFYNNWLEWGGKNLVEEAQRLSDLDPRVIKALEFATQQWRKKYLLGGEGPDQWDCARLVYFAYKKAGVNFSGSIAGGKVVADQWSNCGRILAEDEEKLPGDLVIFNNAGGRFNHVGMMIYPPACFIEATWTGGRVRVTSLSPNYRPIYRADLAGRVKGFKRIIG